MKGLPDFLVIGAMKAGTTTLFHDLNQHPEIYIPPTKELAVLRQDAPPSELAERYQTYFAHPPKGAQLGDVSTYYAMHPRITGVPGRARDTLGPATRLIYIVRHPLKRTHSQCHHLAHHHGKPFEPDVLIKEHPEAIDFSRYAMQLRLWLELFPRDQIKVISLEQYSAYRKGTLEELYRFLGVDPTRAPAETSRLMHNVSANKRTPWGPISRIIQTPGYDRTVRRFVPRGMRHATLRIFSRPAVTTQLPFSPAIEQMIWDALSDDMTDFEALTGISYSRQAL